MRNKGRERRKHKTIEEWERQNLDSYITNRDRQNLYLYLTNRDRQNLGLYPTNKYGKWKIGLCI